MVMVTMNINTLSFASAKPPNPPRHSAPAVVPSSMPNGHPASSLTASRPPQANGLGINGAGPLGKARRMSSSTQGALARGKLGLTGELPNGKDIRPPGATLVSPATASSTRIGARVGTSPTPQLFDFSKTDRNRVGSGGRTVSASAVPASLPVRGPLARHVQSPPLDDMEFDMEFEDDDDGEVEGGSGRSGSAEMEDADVDMGDLQSLALGTGSGGIKGRRKGHIYKCLDCGKQYRHPICLTKHRWEHTPFWKEPNQLSMSKHQQVQALEGAAILLHMNPALAAGRSLPVDKSLWPAILSPAGENVPLPGRRASRDASISARSPPSSVLLPLTPSSLREPSSFGGLSNKDRKSSPSSDTTTSSMGASEPIVPRPNPAQSDVLNPGIRTIPVGIKPRSTSIVSGMGLTGISPHSQSVGSLPNAMAGLHFRPYPTPSSGMGYSPVPDRGIPMSLGARAGLIGGGMFSVREGHKLSSVRSGVRGTGDEKEDEGVDYGMAGDMEL
ncbi:hypothetical protein M231_07185 [Tremella mesenterica]|uniref:C2H2-type domain-containing protein n=1 Tax=Tremella mesenterica TaxID=5217 RepID=A0A4Q1BFY1_TREME|nr:hypothetical protein M231_07185 [Tremella mesenterica]